MLDLKIPPAVVFVATAALMWLGAKAVPAGDYSFSPVWSFVTLIMPAAVGCLLIVRAIRLFRRLDTTIDPRHPQQATSLVTDDVYRLTRNPMYVGMAFLLLTWGVYLANIAAIAVTALFIVYIDRFQIVPEEKALTARFGMEYECYKTAVRRWL